jgi:hypothetical protein
MPRLVNPLDQTAKRSDRFLLFGMPTGFVKDPVGLDLDDDFKPGDLPFALPSSAGDDPFDFLQVSVGIDNPYFDFRRPGEPGGVGFYRLHSQLPILDDGKSGLNVSLGAVTPAGLESDGVQEGPTIFSPALAYYCDLWEGMTVQAFVGNYLRANSRAAGSWCRNARCGIAAQHPVPFTTVDADHGLFFFVEALGRYRIDASEPGRQSPPLEFMPGLHLRLQQNWWITGGLVLPMAAPRPESNLWQITCSWRF